MFPEISNNLFISLSMFSRNHCSFVLGRGHGFDFGFDFDLTFDFHFLSLLKPLTFLFTTQFNRELYEVALSGWPDIRSGFIIDFQRSARLEGVVLPCRELPQVGNRFRLRLGSGPV